MFHLAIFVFTWSPYAVVALYSSFGDPEKISPLGAVLPAVFAKSSMLWSSLYYVLSNKKIKQQVFNRKLFATEKSEKSDSGARKI